MAQAVPEPLAGAVVTALTPVDGSLDPSFDVAMDQAQVRVDALLDLVPTASPAN